MEEKYKLNVGDVLHHNTRGNNNVFVVLEINGKQVLLDWIKCHNKNWNDTVNLSINAIFEQFGMVVMNKEIKDIEDD